METFEKISTKEKGIILSFLKDQKIIGIHLTLKKRGEDYLLKKYPIEGKNLIGGDQKFHLSGTIESISQDGEMVYTKKLRYHTGDADTVYDDSSYETLQTEFLIPIELIDDIRIILKRR
ncbi:MAG: hypothetical protein WC010_01165 [Candidatus Absconditabacterales bacterium]